MDNRMVKRFLSLAVFLSFIIVYVVPLQHLATHSNFDIKEWFSQSYIIKVIYFSCLQSLVSAMSSVILAIFIGRAFNNIPIFFGRSWLLYSFDLALALPSLLIVLAIIDIYGKQGWYANIFGSYVNLYNIKTIILAHVIINLPYCLKVVMNSLSSIDANSLKLSEQLNFKSKAKWLNIEWPALKKSIKHAFMITTLNCMTSLPVILTFGGSPARQTIETSLYYVLKFDNDFSQIWLLALVQIVINSFVLTLCFKESNYNFLKPNADLSYRNYKSNNILSILWDVLLILLSILLILAPILAIISRSLAGLKVLSEVNLWLSIKNSILIAVMSTCGALIIGGAILILMFICQHVTKQKYFVKIIYYITNINLMISPLIWSMALFMWFNSVDIDINLKYLLIFSNISFLTSYHLSVLKPIIMSFDKNYLKLSDSLAIKNFNFFKIVIWPIIKKPYIYVIATGLMLSFGNLGVSILFNNHQFMTMPYYLYSKLGSYRTCEASTIASIMLFIMLIMNIATHKIAHYVKT